MESIAYILLRFKWRRSIFLIMKMKCVRQTRALSSWT